MLKRQIAILIAGGLLGAQVTLAAAAQGTFPPAADELRMLPALTKYLDQRAASNLTGAPGNVFPPAADELRMLPALARYLEQRAASQRTGASGTQPRWQTRTTANPYDRGLMD